MKNIRKIGLLCLSFVALPLCGCNKDTKVNIKPEGKKVEDTTTALRKSLANVQKQFSCIQYNEDGTVSEDSKKLDLSFYGKMNNLSFINNSTINRDGDENTKPSSSTQELVFNVNNLDMNASIGGIEGVSYDFDTNSRANKIEGQYKFNVGQTSGHYIKDDPSGFKKHTEYAFDFNDIKFESYLADNILYADPTNGSLRLLLRNVILSLNSYFFSNNALISESTVKNLTGEYDTMHKKVVGGLMDSKYKIDVSKFTNMLIKSADEFTKAQAGGQTTIDIEIDDVIRDIQEYTKWIETYELQDGSYSYYISLNQETATKALNELKVKIKEKIKEYDGKSPIDVNEIFKGYDDFVNSIRLNTFEVTVNIGDNGFNYVKSYIDGGLDDTYDFYETTLKKSEEGTETDIDFDFSGQNPDEIKSKISSLLDIKKIGTMDNKVDFKFDFEFGLDKTYTSPVAPEDLDKYSNLSEKITDIFA